ncbi:MAG: VOC family protein [Bacilli bacterium]|nr:VOC family protein [Bacilli bacterium]
MKFNSLIPELSVTNIDKSKVFYLQLGFKIMYERVEDKFAFLQLENNQLMIQEENDTWNVGTMEYPFGRGINLSMSIKNVEDMYNRLKKKKIIMFKDLEIHSYRVSDIIYEDKEFLIQDPDGYLLRFNN